MTTLVCFLISHARLRVHRAPGFPCALFIEGGSYNNSGAIRAAGMRVCVLAVWQLNSFHVVPDKRAIASADPGPIATYVRHYAKPGPQRARQLTSVVMGPRVRGEDEERSSTLQRRVKKGQPV